MERTAWRASCCHWGQHTEVFNRNLLLDLPGAVETQRRSEHRAIKLELALPPKGPLSCLISCRLPPTPSSSGEVKGQPHSPYRVRWIRWAGKASVFIPSYWKLITFSEAWKGSFKKLAPPRHSWNGKPPGWRGRAQTHAFFMVASVCLKESCWPSRGV